MKPFRGKGSVYGGADGGEVEGGCVVSCCGAGSEGKLDYRSQE